MKCPYRKIIKHQIMGISSTDTIDIEEFAECYGDECPYYAPEKQWRGFTISEACGRTITNETIKEYFEEWKSIQPDKKEVES